MSQDRTKAWLSRATTQFARTVYTELRRAGHTKPDIVRFINEMMDLLSQDSAPSTGPVEPPALIDPEAGLPDAVTLHDLLEFELRARLRDRRQEEKLVVLAIDVTLPSWTSGAARQRSHEILAAMFAHGRRAADIVGQLGPDRYLVVLPRSKDGVRASLTTRISQLLNDAADELADALTLELRWTVIEPNAPATTAIAVLEQCLASPPEILRPVRGQRTAATTTPSRSAGVSAPAGRSIVLALGGGAARAAAHAGVLEVLASADIRPVAIAGCSAGALVGAMFAKGMTPRDIAAKFAGFTSTTIYKAMRQAYADFLRGTRAAERQSRPRYFGASSLAFYSDTALSVLPEALLGEFVEHFIGADCDIARLPMPFSVVATDLVLGQAISLSHGSLSAALAASCSVPGLFPPQARGDRLLVDGSTITEVPIGTAHLLGVAAPVLAVYMERPFPRIDDYQTSTEVSTRANALVHAELVREQLRRSDLLLAIPMQGVGWLDFRRAASIVELGRATAEAGLPVILSRLDRSA